MKPRLQKLAVCIDPDVALPPPVDQRATAEIVRRINARMEREIEAMIPPPGSPVEFDPSRLTRPLPAYPFWMTKH